MPVLQRIIIISCCTILSCLPHDGLADEPSSIPVYLPIDAPQLESTAKKLAQSLSLANLHQFKVQTIKSWSSYQLALRDAQKGVFLAAPHYAAWAVRKHNYVPLLRIKDHLKYVLAVRKNNSQLFELNDLKNRPVCTQKPLNLDYLMVNHAFNNALQGATIISVESPQREMRLDSSKCQGFAISEHHFVQIAQQFPDKFIRLHQSQVLNNYSIVAHPDINRRWLNSLRKLLLQQQSTPALAPILSQFALHPHLVPVNSKDYSKDEYSPLLPYW